MRVVLLLKLTFHLTFGKFEPSVLGPLFTVIVDTETPPAKFIKLCENPSVPKSKLQFRM